MEGKIRRICTSSFKEGPDRDPPQERPRHSDEVTNWAWASRPAAKSGQNHVAGPLFVGPGPFGKPNVVPLQAQHPKGRSSESIPSSDNLGSARASGDDDRSPRYQKRHRNDLGWAGANPLSDTVSGACCGSISRSRVGFLPFFNSQGVLWWSYWLV